MDAIKAKKMDNLIYQMSPLERLFTESETSFGIIAKISDEDLRTIQGNKNLSSENRNRVDYEIRVRNIEIPKELKLTI